MTDVVTTAKQLPQQFKIKASHYILGGLSLVAALTWNDAIKASIQRVYPLEGDQLGSLILAAAVITMIVIIASYILPSTNSELPAATQQKIAEETIKEADAKVAQLEETVTQLQQERLQMVALERFRTR